MSFIAIPGILLLRGIIVEYHSHRSLQPILSYKFRSHDPYYTNSWSIDQRTPQVHSGSVNRNGLSSPQANAWRRKTPSCRRHPAGHLLGSSVHLHSLAIWIARDTAVSTLKYSQTNTNISIINSSQGILSSSFFCIKPILVHRYWIKTYSCANQLQWEH